MANWAHSTLLHAKPSEAIQYFHDYVTLWLKRGSGFGSMMHSSDCPLHIEFW